MQTEMQALHMMELEGALTVGTCVMLGGCEID